MSVVVSVPSLIDGEIGIVAKPPALELTSAVTTNDCKRPVLS